MNAKRVVNFLVLRSAFSRRNFTSLFLVGIFVAVYVMSGGKLSTTLPRIKDGGGFGSTTLGEVPVVAETAKLEKSKALEVLGMTPSEDRINREETLNRRGRLFDPEVDGTKEKPIDKNGLIQGDTTDAQREELKLRKEERRPTDSFSAIEQRLNIKRK